MSEKTNGYAFQTRLSLPYEQAIEKVTAELAKEGFGILTEIDIKKTLKKKLGIDFPKYIILGACNPPIAHQALGVETEVGLLLPCNVIVYEDGEGSVMSIVDPAVALGVAKNPDLNPMIDNARARLLRVIDSLQG